MGVLREDLREDLIDRWFGTAWEEVGRARTSVHDGVVRACGEPGPAHALAMVAGELVENAIKYGDGGAVEPRGHLRVWCERSALALVVDSVARDGDRGAEEVVHTLRWMRGHTSASEAYRARLVAIAAAGGAVVESKLGLVRIAYEAGCALTAERIGGVLRVQAVRSVLDPGQGERSRVERGDKRSPLRRVGQRAGART